jgi:hypothetical protein
MMNAVFSMPVVRISRWHSSFGNPFVGQHFRRRLALLDLAVHDDKTGIVGQAQPSCPGS